MRGLSVLGLHGLSAAAPPLFVDAPALTQHTPAVTIGGWAVSMSQTDAQTAHPAVTIGGGPSDRRGATRKGPAPSPRDAGRALRTPVGPAARPPGRPAQPPAYRPSTSSRSE